MLIAFLRTPAQPVPVLTCLSVISPGSVEAVWEVPAGSPSFDSYRLFYRESGSGGFTPVDYPPSTTNAILNIPNVSTKIYEFFIVTINNSPYAVSSESNHLETMLLTVSGSGTGIARLEWNKQSADDQSYRVYRSDNNSTFNLLNTTSAFKYNDTINRICDTTTLYYRIVTGVCAASSTVDSGRFIDATTPLDPVLELVTVNESGLAVLSWNPSPSSDVTNYIIERGNPTQGFFNYRTTGNVTTFTDDFINDADYLGPCDNIVTYIVRAEDQCGRGSAGDYGNLHSNMMITGNTIELCDRKATINWNAYKNMKPPVSRYILEKSVNGSQFIQVLDIPVTNNSLYEAVDPELLEPGIEVKYRIAAKNADNSLVSHSCALSLIPQPEVVTDFDIDFVTVTDNSFITIQASSQPADVPREIQVYRSSGDELALINTVDWNTSGILTVEDLTAEVASTSYDYELVALDSCGFIIARSSVFNSIHLTIGVTNDINVSLDWTNQTGWGTNLANYLVYKYNDGVLMQGYPVTVSADLTSYNETDDASNSLATTYVVEAIKNDGKTSRSNEVLLPRSAEIDVPTAFRPSGVNRIFRPLVKNIDQSAYRLLIFNQWGQQIFSTSDPLAGWDGRINGNIQQGIYLYLITYTDQTGQEGSKRGVVMLLD